MSRLRLGILGAEFFDLALGRQGGFGRIVQTVARLFGRHPALGIDVVLLHGFREAPPDRCHVLSGDIPVVLRPQGRSRLDRWLRYRSLLQREAIDVMLAMDYSASYRRTFLVLPRTPVIIWAHDPRTPTDWDDIATLRVPGPESSHPAGTAQDDRRSLGLLARIAQVTGRPLLFAAPEPFIVNNVAASYGLRRPNVTELPVFLDFQVDHVVKSSRPRVVYLGRLDPIKRPWIFFQLAKAMPEVEFLCVGGTGGWTPDPVPPNLKLMGHLSDQARVDVLTSAWALVNTSIHESLPMSFLEAWACETPVVSCQPAGGFVSRFGAYVGRWPGTGLEALPRFVEVLQRLLEDGGARGQIGLEARRWVGRSHNPGRFLAALGALLAQVGFHVDRDQTWLSHEASSFLTPERTSVVQHR